MSSSLARADQAKRPLLYTIGHSRHSLDAFFALLSAHRIEVLADARGQPYSRFNPQFNREPFQRALREAGIQYWWVGGELSGRPRDPRYRGPGSEVLWAKLCSSPAFGQRLDELAARARDRRIALVCAEEDPRRCHRRFLLTPPLLARGVDVLHIRGDGRVEPETEIASVERSSGSGRQLDIFGAEGC